MDIDISTDRAFIDLNYVHNYLCNESYWAKGRSLEKVEASIQGSRCFVVLLDDKQIGFARVVSDDATFAYIADLFIDQDYRKRGYSKRLISTILEYPSYKTVERWMLLTGDAQKLYKKFGFKKTRKAKWVMEYLPGRMKKKKRGNSRLRKLLNPKLKNK